MSETQSSARTAGATVRPALWADADAFSAMMGRAFFDDPLMSHFLPDDAARPRQTPRVFRLLLKLGLPYGACDITSGTESAALWRPPNTWQIPMWQYITNGWPLLNAFGTRAFGVMMAMEHIEKHHPREPHWYLQAIGTDTDKQGKGFGSLIMRHRLQRIDESRMPAYLESSKEKNIPIYQSQGFELTGEIKIPNGPTVYPMWRKPR